MKQITLNIEGKEIEFSFGLGFLGELMETLDIGIDEAVDKLNKNPFKMIPIFMYQSALYAKKRRDETLELTFYEFTDLLEESGGVGTLHVRKFLETFTNSLTKDVPKVENSGNDSKKK